MYIYIYNIIHLSLSLSRGVCSVGKKRGFKRERDGTLPERERERGVSRGRETEHYQRERERDRERERERETEREQWVGGVCVHV
jgi:hypothetical protein